MLRLAHWKISAHLCNDQPLDACGYIAADAVCRLRDAALSEANSWHDTQLPDYAELECISRANKVLRKKGDDRILNADEVNRLVRHYSHLDRRHQAAEEWWGGAIAIDHFLTGLPNSIQEISAGMADKQHRWRAWIVNTQTSAQLGSHWFTVVLGAKIQLLQSTGDHRTSASSSQPLGTAAQLLQSPGEHRASPSSSSHLATDTTANSDAATKECSELPEGTASATASRATSSTEQVSTGPNRNDYPNLFDSPDPALSDALRWAQANAMHPEVESWLDACSQWDSAIATGAVSYTHLTLPTNREV
mgnify:CR=1 FL=1